jgi:hypothetical protein
MTELSILEMATTFPKTGDGKLAKWSPTQETSFELDLPSELTMDLGYRRVQ